MLIDEAHVVDEESGTFKEPYGAILPMCAPLPSSTIWAAVTGTATPARALAIGTAWGFNVGDIRQGSLLHVGIVTDTCTYGTDIPMLSRVIIAHVGDLGGSPEIRKQQMGHPSWVKNAPASEIRTKQDHTNLLRREQLPVITHKFFNPMPLCCLRSADLKYNGEPFILHPGSGVLYAPEPEQSRDLGMVARCPPGYPQVHSLKTLGRLGPGI
ncbi:hypothetical protein B0H10DRAFT_1950878 [Mycena sp. CBHHK59/15]|nr:hypothetical protein B0H10DRAFT_1950878 [Mycena sp. CBHHK59/15]